MSNKKTTPPLRGTPPKEENDSPSPKGWQAKPDGVVPRLRFPEFRDAGEWEEKQLRKIAKSVSDKFLDKDNDNILTLSGEHGLVLQSDYFGKKIAGDNVSRYIRIAINDFVYNDRTTKSSTYGSIKRLSKYESGIVSPIYKCFRFGYGENPVFWDWYFESGFHEPQLHGLVNEGARAGRFNISIEKFLSTLVWHPGGAEQQKIADCLSSIDDLITAQTQKLNTLKTHKKGLMQHLFPAEGKTLPNLRFPEFQDAPEWKERRLEDVCERIMDGTHFSPKSKEGLQMYLTSKNIQDGAIKLSNVSYISEEEHRQIYAKCPVMHNDVLLTKDGANTGNCALNKLKFEFSLLSSVAVLRGNPLLVDQSFLYQTIQSDKVQKLIKESMSGQAITRITLEKISNFKISIAGTKEQQKIADCLSSIDDLIASQTQKLATLKTHKKALMQQLFQADGNNHPAPSGHPSRGGQ